MFVGPLSPAERMRLAARIAVGAVWVRNALRRMPLPDLVHGIQLAGGQHLQLEPRRLGRIVFRVMNVLPFRPRCLTMALVLLRMLHRQGTTADLVVGVPNQPVDHLAHAWIEVEGRDVGPPPGKAGHKEFARYGPPAGS